MEGVERVEWGVFYSLLGSKMAAGKAVWQVDGCSWDTELDIFGSLPGHESVQSWEAKEGSFENSSE